MPQPNVLFVAADDLCQIEMLKLLINGFSLPNLEAFAAGAADFRRGYCVVPVCEPARTAVMTGMSPAATKSFDLKLGWKDLVRPEHLWLYQFRQAGYHIVSQGKIFHGYTPQPQWVYDILYTDTPFSVGAWSPSGASTSWPGAIGGTGWDNDTDWYDYSVAQRAIDFINSYDGDAPWYCEVGFYKPHIPFQAPNRVFASIDMEDVQIPAEWAGGWDELPFAATYFNSGNDAFSGVPDPADWTEADRLAVRGAIRNYAAAALWMDECFGRLIDALDASPHAANTVVTFYSDHGYHLADHNRWHKFTTYEQAAAAPLIIRAPGQPGRIVQTPVSHIDLGPTLLDYADLPISPGRRGVSLRPLIEGVQGAAHDLVPTFWYNSASVIGPGLKRVTVYSDGSSEMFDTAADWWGQHNIAETDPDFAGLRDTALEIAYEWGFLLAEQAVDLSRPSLIQGYIGTEPAEDVPVGTSLVALGDFHAKGQSPWYKRMYSAPSDDNPVVRMPPHVKSLHVMGERWASGSTTTIIANDQDNDFILIPSPRAMVEIDLGGGNDTLDASGGGTVLTVHARSGNNLIRLTPGRQNIVYGGTGNDTIYGSTGHEYLAGGDGDDYIDGGAGNDTLISGSGNDTLTGGAGDDRLINDAGMSVMTGGSGSDVFRVARTGHVSTITDLTSADTIDLADWAPIQPVKVTQVGADVHVTAGVEMLICQGTTAATVTARITGATTNG